MMALLIEMNFNFVGIIGLKRYIIILNDFFFLFNAKLISFSKKIVRPVNAFLIVDVQNDFISGSLNISNCSAQQNGLEVRIIS